MSGTPSSRGELYKPIKTSEFQRYSPPKSMAGNVVTLGSVRNIATSDGGIHCAIYALEVNDWPRPVVTHLTAKPVDAYVAECESKGRGAALMAARRRLAERASAEGAKKSLKGLRLALGLSQAELAKAMGTTQPRVARLEAGREEPGLKTIQKLASALEVDFNTLMEVF